MAQLDDPLPDGRMEEDPLPKFDPHVELPHPWMYYYIARLQQTRSRQDAAHYVGRSRQAVWQNLQRHAAFREQVEAALRAVDEEDEDKYRLRAVDGWNEEKVFCDPKTGAVERVPVRRWSEQAHRRWLEVRHAHWRRTREESQEGQDVDAERARELLRSIAGSVPLDAPAGYVPPSRRPAADGQRAARAPVDTPRLCVDCGTEMRALEGSKVPVCPNDKCRRFRDPTAGSAA